MFKIFAIENCGSVRADVNNENGLPIVHFEAGERCTGLPRKFAEVEILGYAENEIALANFEHECAHLFLAHELGYLTDSIQFLAATGETFEDYTVILKASKEERIVLGFQIAVNDVIGDLVNTPKVGGFLLHVAYATQEYAKQKVETVYNRNFYRLVKDFKERLAGA